MSIHDNDDDLFDYEPENVSVKETYIDNQDKPNSDSEFINSIKDNFDDISDKGSLKGLEVRLGSAFMSAANFYVSNASQNGHAYAARYVLDEISNGKFSLLELFKTTEAKIIKLVEFIELCESILEDENNFINQISELIGVTLTQLHIKSVYNTHVKIARHSLLINRAIYLQLSEQLSLPVHMELFDPKPDTTNIDYQYSSLVSKINSNIISQYSRSISDKLQEVFDVEISYFDPQTEEDT